MSKHTPGPWHQVGAWVEVEDDEIPDICSCNPESIEQGHLKWDWETAIANARLIAAAPDLLEALKAIVKSLADQDDEGLIENAQQMIDARAAIDKATGGQE